MSKEQTYYTNDIINEITDDVYYTERELCKIALRDYINKNEEEKFKHKLIKNGLVVTIVFVGIIFIITKIIGG